MSQYRLSIIDKQNKKKKRESLRTDSRQVFDRDIKIVVDITMIDFNFLPGRKKMNPFTPSFAPVIPHLTHLLYNQHKQETRRSSPCRAAHPFDYHIIVKYNGSIINALDSTPT